jgi:hypothetical protein
VCSAGESVCCAQLRLALRLTATVMCGKLCKVDSPGALSLPSLGIMMMLSTRHYGLSWFIRLSGGKGWPTWLSVPLPGCTTMPGALQLL